MQGAAITKNNPPSRKGIVGDRSPRFSQIETPHSAGTTGAISTMTTSFAIRPKKPHSQDLPIPSFNNTKRKKTAAPESDGFLNWYRVGDSNPCRMDENHVS